MSLDEYAAWLPATIMGYADSLAVAEGWSTQRAESESKKSFDELLPDGLETENHWIWTIVHESVAAGSLWMGRHPTLSDAFWIWGIKVDVQYRSQGIGTKALIDAEDAAHKLGGRRVELNVFDGNDPAIRIYERLGYTMVLRKRGSSTLGKDL
jgi:ribosomal protein S18 acetylase RimI-like enzyme